ncbi:MAG: glycoside hydrolase family 13 protein [Spirochaetales bacterium]
MQDPMWWKRAVVYQIYPRSFQDSNGDGIGDLPGIVERLDYLSELGIDTIWLSPIYDSPNDDNGYDIRDYRAIHPEFGSMDDFDRLIREMHARNLRLVMDLVVNHCSDEHEWFREAKASRRSPKHDWFLWHPGRGHSEPTPKGSPVPDPPNNWGSFFRGSAWEWNETTREYYLHLFSRKQPDLNWDNPELRAEIYDMMRFWLAKGVDGFRMDVINFIGKPDGFPDAPNPHGKPHVLEPAMVANLPKTHEYLKEMNREVLSPWKCMTVGEMHATGTEEGIRYVHPARNELNMIFQFEHMYIDDGPAGKYDVPRQWSLTEMKHILDRWQDGLAGRGWNSLFTGNHDQPRAVSRFGNDGGASAMQSEWQEAVRARSATAIAAALLLMQGTPFIYQGEEIGMTNVSFPDIDSYRDIETLNFYHEAAQQPGANHERLLEIVHRRSRDNARTPMQWTSGAHAGFTTSVPWIPVNPNFTGINVSAERHRPQGVFAFFKRMIALRRAFSVFTDGAYTDLLPEHAQLVAYTRSLADEDPSGGPSQVLIVVNFSNDPVQWIPEPQTSELLVTGLLSNTAAAPEGIRGRGSILSRDSLEITLAPWEAFLSTNALPANVSEADTVWYQNA